MTGSKSSQTTRSVVLAFLALWSIVSLIIIVVWATRPDLKISPLSSECRAELQVSEETLQRTKENMQKDRRALETMVEEIRGNLEEVEGQRNLLTAVLEMTNATLQNCTVTNDILRSNISVLEQHIQTHIQTERNLTAVNSDLQDTVEVLQQNVTELTLHTQACQSLRVAAESHMSAAQFQNTACNASKLLMHKQLLRCKDDVAAATAVAEKLRSSKTETEDEDEERNGSSRLQTFSFSLMTFLCWSVILLVCK